MEDPDPRVLRDGIVELLQLLGSLEEQKEYERTVPIANVPAELVCMWFGDSYHPESVFFQAAFTPTELQVLDHFHRFYEARRDSLPTDGGIYRLHSTPAWSEIVQMASWALRQIEAPPNTPQQTDRAAPGC